MSHNYPYRLPPSDTDIRTPNVSADRQRPSGNAYRPSQHSYPSSYPASSSSTSSSSSSARSLAVPQDVLGVLSSCGLEPDDLARLAELPEDVLTVESLPHILQQMKGKRGTVKPFTSSTSTSSSSSYSSSSQHPSSASQPSAGWDQLRNQPVQYPTMSSTRVPDRWGAAGTSSSARADPLPSLSGHVVHHVDVDLRAGASKYGKTGPAPSFRPAGRGQNPRASRFSDSALPDRPAPPAPVSQPQQGPQRGRQGPTSSSSRSIRPRPGGPIAPTRKQAVDFHGTSPAGFPHSCSLCDITVLSNKVWIQHINSTQHADGQLNLLQEFPKWDCRLESARGEDQSEGWNNERHPAPTAHPVGKNQAAPQPNKTTQKKTQDKGKVVCVKFPPQSVDEAYLRKLTEPFGRIVKILMFPSLAFVELGSVDQAKDLVKFHSNYPPTVNGEQMEFSISNTFNFLQSSQVVSFTPAPAGQDGLSDLISIVKRFGAPLYTLFLPSKVFVEMTTVTEAQKLVDYYSSRALRLNDDCIKVSFSGEYRSLAQVPSARKYWEEEPRTVKRARSSSQEHKDSRRRRSRSRSKSRSKSKDKKTRTRSRSKSKSKDKKTRTRSRSRSRSKSRDKKTRTRSRSKSKDKKTRNRSRSRDKKTRARSRSKSKEKKTRTRSRSKEKKTRTRSRSKSKDKSGEGKQTRSESKSSSQEKPSRENRSESGSRENPADPRKPAQIEAGAAAAPVEDAKPAELEVKVKVEKVKVEKVKVEEEEEEEEERLSTDDSDIEGMEVIAEDGEEVEDEEEEWEEEKEEEEETHSAEHGGIKREEKEEQQQQEEEEGGENKAQVKTEEEPDKRAEPQQEEEEVGTVKEEQQQEEEEEDEGFPMDLENCITLDEIVEEEREESGDEAAGSSEPSSRVLYVSNLPPRFYTDTEFIALVQDFGTAVQYLLIRNQRKGFIEMSTSSEASRAAKELRRRSVVFKKAKLIIKLSDAHKQLTNGWPVKPEDSEERRTRSSSRRSGREGRASSLEKDEQERRSKGRREKKSPEKELRNASEKESAARETPEEAPTSRAAPEKEVPTSRAAPEKEATTSRAAPEKEAQPREESPGKSSTSREAPEEQQKDESPQKETAQRQSPATPEEEEQQGKGSPQDETPERGRSPPGETLQTKQEVPGDQSPKHEVPTDESAPQTALESEQTEATEKPQDGSPEAAEEENKEAHEEEKDEGGAMRSETPDEEAKDGNVPAEEPAEVLQAAQEKPSEPVGTEFVRPVVGYFCNLCQLIFADEDEAKQDHCRTAAHYSRYQEKTGRDPRASGAGT